ncbi:MAG TPA: hypothetical protein PK208_02050 [Fibrobacteria bacterium]|nr:hypothetical protein [Fibrobacteria bacterium]
MSRPDQTPPSVASHSSRSSSDIAYWIRKRVPRGSTRSEPIRSHPGEAGARLAIVGTSKALPSRDEQPPAGGDSSRAEPNPADHRSDLPVTDLIHRLWDGSS